MILTEERQILDALKAPEPQRAYLLAGEEPYLRDLYLEKILARRPKTGDDFAYQHFDGGRFDLQELAAAVEAVAFLSDRRYVYLQGLEADALSAADSEALCTIAADPPETTTFVITAQQPATPGGKSRLEALKKAVDRSGQVLESRPPQEKDLKEFLRRLASRQGCTLAAAQAGQFLEYTGLRDMGQLAGEMAKLTAYCQGRAITAEDIALLCTQQEDTRTFELSRAVLRQDRQRALEAVDELCFQRVEPVMILSALISSFADLYRAKAALAAGLGQAELEKDFGYRKGDFRVKNALRDAGRFSAGYLRHALRVLGEADALLKSSRLDAQTVLETAVVKLFLKDVRA